jgi:Spy/CpxP family protein refolding chaperone
MKSQTATALLGALLSSAVLMAQQSPAAQSQQQPDTSLSATPTPQSAPQGGANRRQPNPGNQSKMLARALNLTSDQQAQIEPILADRDQRIEALRSNTSLAPKARRQQLQAIQQNSKSRIEALLNDTQKQQFEQLLADRRASRGKGNRRSPKA